MQICSQFYLWGVFDYCCGMNEPRWLNDEEQALWRLCLASVRKASRCIEETLQRSYKLSSPEFAVLVCLSERSHHEIRLRDLCADLNWDRSRTSHQITRMERRGLVRKQKCSGDARGVVVELTDEGWQRLENAAPGHVESVRTLLFDHLTEEEHRILEGFMKKVMEVKGIPGAEEGG